MRVMQVTKVLFAEANFYVWTDEIQEQKQTDPILTKLHHSDFVKRKKPAKLFLHGGEIQSCLHYAGHKKC